MRINNNIREPLGYLFMHSKKSVFIRRRNRYPSRCSTIQRRHQLITSGTHPFLYPPKHPLLESCSYRLIIILVHLLANLTICISHVNVVQQSWRRLGADTSLLDWLTNILLGLFLQNSLGVCGAYPRSFDCLTHTEWFESEDLGNVLEWAVEGVWSFESCFSVQVGM